MKHWEGRLWIRLGRDGKTRTYVYRRRIAVNLENRRKVLDVRKTVGISGALALATAKELDRQYDAIERGEMPEPKMTLGRLVQKYMRYVTQERNLKGWRTIKANLDVLVERIGDIPIEAVTRPAIEKFLAWRSERRQPWTVASTLRDIKRMYAYAQGERLLTDTPSKDIRMPRVARAEFRLPDTEELTRLLDYLKTQRTWLYRIVVTMLSTGCRLGEVVAMRWEHIDFTRTRITFQRPKVKDMMVLPMGKQMREVLWQHWMDNGTPRQGCVFLNENGQPHKKERLYKAFKLIAKRMGYEWMTLKMLRKTAATAAVERTGSVRVAQMLLGHTNSRTTELYLGRGAEAKEQGIKALEGFLDEVCAHEVGIKTGTNLGTQDLKENPKEPETSAKTI